MEKVECTTKYNDNEIIPEQLKPSINIPLSIIIDNLYNSKTNEEVFNNLKKLYDYRSKEEGDLCIMEQKNLFTYLIGKVINEDGEVSLDFFNLIVNYINRGNEILLNFIEAGIFRLIESIRSDENLKLDESHRLYFSLILVNNISNYGDLVISKCLRKFPLSLIESYLSNNNNLNEKDIDLYLKYTFNVMKSKSFEDIHMVSGLKIFCRILEDYNNVYPKTLTSILKNLKTILKLSVFSDEDKQNSDISKAYINFKNIIYEIIMKSSNKSLVLASLDIVGNINSFMCIDEKFQHYLIERILSRDDDISNISFQTLCSCVDNGYKKGKKIDIRDLSNLLEMFTRFCSSEYSNFSFYHKELSYHIIFIFLQNVNIFDLELSKDSLNFLINLLFVEIVSNHIYLNYENRSLHLSIIASISDYIFSSSDKSLINNIVDIMNIDEFEELIINCANDTDFDIRQHSSVLERVFLQGRHN